MGNGGPYDHSPIPPLHMTRQLTFDYVTIGGGAVGCVIAARPVADQGPPYAQGLQFGLNASGAVDLDVGIGIVMAKKRGEASPSQSGPAKT